jgi:acetyl-CoA carboxylase carboxyl transferase subunit beta
LNWLSKKFKRIKPKIKNLFRVKIGPEGKLWESCKCGAIIYKQDLKENFFVCPKCSDHHRLDAAERLSIFFDDGQYTEINYLIGKDDPLNFVDTKSLKRRIYEARQETNQIESIIVAEGKLNNIDIVCGAQSFSFIGGSLSPNAGEFFTQGCDIALRKLKPMVMFWASGGIQVQTSLFGLNNMPKCISAINDLKKAGIPFISVFTNPVAGGVTCIALLGDINLAEPKSTISFAGRRVIEQNIREKLPENFQSSEWAFDIGIIDIVCQRKDLRKTISTILSQLTNKNKTFFSDSQIINERQQSPLGTIRSINSISKTSP